jgi:hypothetical protein
VLLYHPVIVYVLHGRDRPSAGLALHVRSRRWAGSLFPLFLHSHSMVSIIGLTGSLVNWIVVEIVKELQ